MLFDTHLHLIYPDQLKYPWLESVDILNKPSRYDSYKKKAARLGIKTCLHMEVDVEERFIGQETTLVAELMKNEGGPLKGAISACRPESKEFVSFLEKAQENPIIKGFRRVLHVVPDNLSQTDVFRSNIKRLSGSGLTFDICVQARQLALAKELVDYCPDVTFILDHCGVPDIKARDMSAWKLHITELSKRKNLLVKISGIIAYGDNDTWSLDDIKPYFEHAVSAFGFERIIWGSDSPVCNLGGGIETWVAATYAITNSWTTEERRALLCDNALNLWSLTKD